MNSFDRVVLWPVFTMARGVQPENQILFPYIVILKWASVLHKKSSKCTHGPGQHLGKFKSIDLDMVPFKIIDI